MAGPISSSQEAEDMLGLLEELKRMGGDLSSLPPDLAELVQQGLLQGQATPSLSTGQQQDADMQTEEITPEPGFVVKTQDEAGRKVFINMVSHPRVAAPGNWAGGVVPEEVQQALENVDTLTQAQAESLRFPLSCSEPHVAVDKKGDLATAYDCCLNTDVINMCGAHRPLKSFIITLALNWINHKHKTHLDPKYKLPRMRYKGERVAPHRIRRDRAPLVTQVRDVPEDPTFPLLTKKLPPGKQLLQPPGPAQDPAAAATSQASPAAAAGGGPQAQTSQGQQGSGAPGSASASAFSFSGTGRSGAASPPQFTLLGAPQLLGKPVDHLQVELQLPASLATQLATAAAGIPGPGAQGRGVQAVLSSVRVEVCGQQLWVAAPDVSDLLVPLPLAVTAQGASAVVDCGGPSAPVLRLRLPYLPLTQLVEAAAAHAPHAPGSLQLSSASTALELE